MTITVRQARSHRHQIRSAMLVSLIAASAVVTAYVAVHAMTDTNTRVSSPPAPVHNVDNGQTPSIEVHPRTPTTDATSLPELEAQIEAFDASALIPSMVGLSAQGFTADWSIPELEAQIEAFDASALIPSMAGLSAQGFTADWSIPE